jgi:hypothetical protein
MVRFGMPFLSALLAQVWMGTGFSLQQGLVGKDTIFRLTGTSQLLWMEYRAASQLPWDTLWVVLRTPDKIQGAYRLYRVKADPLLYRGQIRVRTASIYVALIMPPREYRQILKQKRFYVTDASHPTLASLRTKAQAQAAQTQPSDLSDVSIENLELPSEALLSAPNEKIEEPPIEDDSIDLEVPDLDTPDIEEENLDLEDLGNLDDL